MAAFSEAMVHVVLKERTHRDVVRFKMEWTITSFTAFKEQTNAMFNSGVTMNDRGPEVAEDYQGRWRIRLNPCWVHSSKGLFPGGPDRNKYLSVYLQLTDTNIESQSYTGDKICAEYHTTVTTGKAMDVVIFDASGIRKEQIFSASNSTLGYSKVVTHTRLFGHDADWIPDSEDESDAVEEPALIKDDYITIVMEVLMCKKPKTVRVSGITAPHPDRLDWEFIRRQMEWFRSEHHRQFSDFTLASNDNKEFHVHRSALMAHSSFFEDMFTRDGKEKQSARFILEDVDGESLELLLDYVYGCDTRKLTSNNAEKVLIMAQKYEMVDLRTFCEQVLVDNVPVEKAVHYLILASQGGLIKLKAAALDVTSKNMGTALKIGALDEIIQSDPHLLVTIMEYCSDKMNAMGDAQRAILPG